LIASRRNKAGVATVDHHFSGTDTARVALVGATAAEVADPKPAGRPIPRDPDALLFGAEAAYLAALSVRTFEALRLRGGGPPYIKLGRAVRYQRRAVLEWAAAKVRSSTSEHRQGCVTWPK
jgi:predicted DNA-binding transcriptional regulator AlpA